jgi:hypothetical protein
VTQRTDLYTLRSILLNTIFYYNSKEKVDAALSKINEGSNSKEDGGSKKEKDDS